MKQGQILLIIVFALSFVLLAQLLLLAPIRDKIIRVKELEFTYQAAAHAESGVELSFLESFKKIQIRITVLVSTSSNDNNCGGLDIVATGTCYHFIYQPISDQIFKTDIYVFEFRTGTGNVYFYRVISDGFMGRFSRKLFGKFQQ